MSVSEPLEVELKYRVLDDDALERLLDTEWLGEHATGPWRTVQVEDRYFDTADGRLSRAGFAARVRADGGQRILTLKSRSEGEGRGGALFRRVELEGPAGEGLDPGTWPPSEARDRLLAIVGSAPLIERFRLRQVRRERELRGLDGWAILSLDDVRVDANGRELGGATFLELEARDGADRLLEEVGALLEASGTVTPEGRSKEALALELLEAQRPLPASRPWAPPPAFPSPAAPEASSAPAPALVPHEDEDAVLGMPAPTAPRDVELPMPFKREVREAEEHIKRDAAGRDEDTPDQSGPDEPRPAEEAMADQAGAKSKPDESGPETSEAPQPRAHPRLETGRSPGVRPDDALAEAGRKVLRFNFAKMLQREDGTREGRDPEELHAMRVATRRMRAAWRVFGDAYRKGRRRRYVDELRTVATALGAVRDRDVLLTSLDAYLATLPAHDQAAMEPLATSWKGAREPARGELVALLDSDRYRDFVRDYLAFVETPGAGARPIPATQPHRVHDTAPSRVWAAYEQVRAYDETLSWADVPTLHQMRIAGKRLRYTLEFFREVLGPDTPQLIGRVTALQDHLGALHDADVAAHLARDFLATSAATLDAASIEAVGRYLASREREVLRLHRTLPAPWRPLVGESFRRALGRAVSVL